MGIEGRKKLRDAITAAIALGASQTAEAEDVRLLDFGNGMRSAISETARENKKKEVVDVRANALTEKEILEQRDGAIEELLAELPQDPALNHLRDREMLEAESQAYAPDHVERARVLERSRNQLRELAHVLSTGEYGIFALADTDTEAKERHRLYVLIKKDDGNLQFVKAYRVSMSRNGFGNEKDSGKTSLGLSYVQYIHKGLLGEVVSAEQNHSHLYKTRIGKKRRPFVGDLGNFPFMEPAAVVTDRYTIDAVRGIHWHGTNRSGSWHIRDGRKVWVTRLGNEGQSGACGRMSNVDVRDFGRFVHPRVVSKGKTIKKGTPVYIHATEEVMRLHEKIKGQT